MTRSAIRAGQFDASQRELKARPRCARRAATTDFCDRWFAAGERDARTAGGGATGPAAGQPDGRNAYLMPSMRR